MLALTVLSPHRDDAAFSLCLALSRWSKLDVPITVVNFFTISSYAPQSSVTAISEVSSLREREDRLALSSINSQIRIEALGLLDAPIRLNISAASISAPENAQLQPAGEIESLTRRMQAPAYRLVLAPLALGNHVDHQAIHSAAVRACSGQRLGFYEDLPYATWTSAEDLAVRIASTEDATHVSLKPVVIGISSDAVSKKWRVVSRYQSQINRQEAKSIARYAGRYGGGERIWIPQHGKLWRTLLS